MSESVYSDDVISEELISDTTKKDIIDLININSPHITFEKADGKNVLWMFLSMKNLKTL